MKKIAFTIVTMLISLVGISQTFSVTADTIEGSFDVGDFPSDYNFVVNTSGASMEMTFELLTNTIPDAGWTVTLCTQQFCMPTVPDSASFGVIADGDQGFFNIHIGFNSTPGDGEISFKIYETADPTNADTIYFIYHATQATGISNNTGEINIHTYPNPSTDVINISGLEPYFDALVNVYGLNGNLIFSEKASSSIQKLNINELSLGTYLIEVRNSAGIIYRSRIIKE